MNRLVCALVLLAGASAHADDKHTVAILSIVPKEAGLTKPATTITSTLRTQASAKASDYRIAATQKQVDSALLAAECNAIEPACAAKLGTTLGSEYAIAGELERRGTHQVLTLSLVDVTKKRRLRSVRQVSSGDAKKLARTAYTRLVGGDLGELAVVANVPQGEVLIDGEVVAGLFEGRASISGLVKGNHLLVIRAKGYKPTEADVTIDAETKQMVLLEPE